jgi:hypothetical protein
MKRLALALLLCVCWTASLAADDVLRNGNFADGLSHWNGDCRSPDATGAGTATGASVELRQDDWTKFTQVFDAPKGPYVVSITFTFAPDSAFTSQEKDYRKVPERLGYTALKKFRLKRGEFCFIVTDTAAGKFTYCGVKPTRDDSTSQTVTGQLTLDAAADQQTFCVAFPPGHGVITVQNVSMTSQ